MALAGWATFTINISGSFAIGFLSMLLIRWLPNPHARLLILTGFLGGYTTFSTLAIRSGHALGTQRKGLALVVIGGSLVAGLVATLLGITLAPTSSSPRGSEPPRLELKAISSLLVPPPTDGHLPAADVGSPDLELPLNAEELTHDLGETRKELRKPT